MSLDDLPVISQKHLRWPLEVFEMAEIRNKSNNDRTLGYVAGTINGQIICNSKASIREGRLLISYGGQMRFNPEDIEYNIIAKVTEKQKNPTF